MEREEEEEDEDEAERTDEGKKRERESYSLIGQPLMMIGGDWSLGPCG